jgi:hypothetical protein
MESVSASAAFTVFTVAVAKEYVPLGSAFHTLVSSIFALKVAANLLAAAVERNQTPINKEANFTGANLFTIESPIGDKHNSPKV